MEDIYIYIVVGEIRHSLLYSVSTVWPSVFSCLVSVRVYLLRERFMDYFLVGIYRAIAHVAAYNFMRHLSLGRRRRRCEKNSIELMWSDAW